MPLGLWNLEWLNHNTERAYPIAQDATRRSASGKFELPNEFICDLWLSIGFASNVRPGSFFISQVGIFDAGFSIVVGYSSDSGTIPVASALIPAADFENYSSYRLEGVGDFYDATGQVVIGRIEAILKQPRGVHEFSLNGSRLETEVIRPQIRGVSSVIVNNGGVRSNPIYGDIELTAGRNARLSTEITENGSELRIDFISGEGSLEECAAASLGEPIRRINSIEPTEDGQYFITGTVCNKLEEITNGLNFANDCAQPCCGDDELNSIREGLEIINRELNTLRAFVTRLDSIVTQTQQSILGSRLSDDGCSS